MFQQQAHQSGTTRFRKLLPSLKGGVFALASLAALASCSQPASHENAGGAVVAGKEPQIALKSHLRLISQEQYRNTLANIFGADAVPALSFAPAERTEGLIAIGGAYIGLTDSQVENYHRIASLVADMVVAPERREFLIPCKPVEERASDKACATMFLSRVGTLLFRRPLSQAKLDEVVGIAGSSADRLKDFYVGLSVSLETMLVSPKTLFIDELWEADPQHPGQMRLDAYSLASRLSFFLWNTAPDSAMLKAAASGELYSMKGRARVVDAMLASVKLEDGVRAFFGDMLGFDAFENLAKDPKVYPAFTGQAVVEAREQTLRMITDHLLTHKGDYRDLFTTRDSFIAPSLATLYQLPAGVTWRPYEAAPNSQRVGLLTQISFLALHSHPGRTSPTLRGKALRELLMCQSVPRPPANVDFSAVENPDVTLKTARERLAAHRANPVCAGCHRITDPMGLALENFDGSGQYRETENGAPIDTSGSLDGKDFKDVVGLSQALHDNPAVPACLVKRVYTYATGGRLDREQQPIVDYFAKRFAAEGYRMPELMRAIALSNSFAAAEPKDAPAAPVKTASASPASEQTTSGNK